MQDQLEQNLRDVLSRHAAQLDAESIERLRATDYRPRRRRIGRLPAFGALGATGVAAAAGVIIALGSTAAPAFAGWEADPTTPAAGQLAQAALACGQNLGSPVLTDSRGPYTAAIYASSGGNSVCLSGNGVSMSSTLTSPASYTVPAGQIQFQGGGRRDSAGDALTMADGRIGAGVSAVTINLSDGSSIQATVGNGWYIAWWPGSVTATDAEVTTASGTDDISFPAAPALTCPAGASNCSMGYSYGGGPGREVGQSSVTAGYSTGSSR